MEFRLLGPLEVVHDGHVLALPAGKQRSLLLLLLLHRNRAISTDRLVEELWEGRSPPTAAKIVRNYASLLRKELTAGGDVELAAEAGGYVLRVPPGAVDIDRFQELADAGRRAFQVGEPAEAAQAYRKALALWRGHPLADVAYETFAQAEASRLEELRLACLEGRIEAELELGGHTGLVPELEGLIREHPLREGFRAQLMLALYQSGRQADALAAYQDARRMLVDDLGLEPGRRLQELERAILDQDPVLDAPAETGWQRRGSLLDSALVAMLLAAVILAAAAIVRGGPDEAGLEALQPNSVGAIDPDGGRIVAQVPLGAVPRHLAAGGDAVWALSTQERTLYRIDAEGRTLTGTAHLEGVVSDLAANQAVALVLHAGPSSAAQVTSFSAYQSVLLALGTFDTGETLSGSGGSSFGLLEDRITAIVEPVPNRFYVTHNRTHGAAVLRGSMAGERIEARATLPAPQFNVASGAGGVWTVSDHLLRRLDPDDLSVLAEIRLASPEIAIDLSVGESAVWVVNQPGGMCCPIRRLGRGLVTRVDPEANAAVATIRVDGDPEAIAAGLGSVWVTDAKRQAVLRIDPRTNRVVDTIALGARPTSVAIAGGLVWVSVQ